MYLCGRKDFNSLDQINRSTYICSLHFESLSGPTDENPEPFQATLSEKDLESRLRRKRKPPKDRQCVEKKIKTEQLDLPSPSTSRPRPNPESALDIDLGLLSGEATLDLPSTSRSNPEPPLDILSGETTPAIGLDLDPKNKEAGTQTIYDKYMLRAKIETMQAIRK